MDPADDQELVHLYFDRGSGYLCLTDGKTRRVVCRVGPDGTIFLYWRKHSKGREVKVTLDDIFRALVNQTDR
jgi:hypothetical protein